MADELLQRIQRLPGVQSAASTRGVPLTFAAFGFGPLRPLGQPFDPQSAIFPDWGPVSPGYFETLQIPILRGRAFQDNDRAGAAEVAIINETLARRLFGGAIRSARR